MLHHEVHITKTSKPWGSSKAPYQSYDFTIEEVASKQEAMTFLLQEYGSCKRSRMYVDSADDKPKHVGYIYHFKDDCERVWRQDWANIFEIQATVII